MLLKVLISLNPSTKLAILNAAQPIRVDSNLRDLSRMIKEDVFGIEIVFHCLVNWRSLYSCHIPRSIDFVKEDWWLKKLKRFLNMTYTSGVKEFRYLLQPVLLLGIETG